MPRGFTNVVHVEAGFVGSGAAQDKAIWRNADVDFNLNFSGPLLLEIDRGLSTTILAGIYVGCFELFAREGIRSVADLKGRTVGVQSLESPPHVFLSAMATLVGLNPAKDIEWVTSAKVKPIELFAEGKIDAFLGFPQNLNVYARKASVASSSTVRKTAHGRSIFAACWRAIANSFERILSPPSAWCAPCSEPRICA